MSNRIIVWDLETVPDIKGFATANNLTGEANCKFDNEVYMLLQEIENEQEIINGRLVKLHTMIGSYSTFEKRWAQFQEQGGVTAEDYYRFVKGRFAPRQVVRKQHLRLVASHRPKSKSLPRKRLNPTDAA